jgi:hypothetical protein
MASEAQKARATEQVKLAAVTRQAPRQAPCSPTCRRQTKRNPLVSDADLDGPESIDPAADHHRDLTEPFAGSTPRSAWPAGNEVARSGQSR